jgi:hypothetical protein
VSAAARPRPRVQVNFAEAGAQWLVLACAHLAAR